MSIGILFGTGPECKPHALELVAVLFVSVLAIYCVVNHYGLYARVWLKRLSLRIYIGKGRFCKARV